MTDESTRRAIDAVWRIESPRLIAGLTRIVRDIGTAEELVQDALVAAMEQWPGAGVPRNPAAWLMLTAKHRAIDLLRRNDTFARKLEKVHGLVALLELQASRSRARIGSGKTPTLLLDQDRSRWDQLLIHRGLSALARSGASSRTRGVAAGTYALQAAIAATHAMARTPDKTDWIRIAGLYAVLADRTRSPVVELNRAVAIAVAYGPAAGLELVDRLTATGALSGYHLPPSVRGACLRNSVARPRRARSSSMPPL